MGAADSIDDPASGSLLGDDSSSRHRPIVHGRAPLITYMGSALGTISLFGPVGGTLYDSRLAHVWHGTCEGGRLLAGAGMIL